MSNGLIEAIVNMREEEALNLSKQWIGGIENG
jgi:hypothetical protein